MTFNPSDDSNAPGSTPSPEAAPASAQGQQAATASGTTPSLSAGFPLPLEKGGGQDFWGGGGAGKAPSEEDVVQIPIEGIPEKVRRYPKRSTPLLLGNRLASVPHCLHMYACCQFLTANMVRTQKV